MLEQYTWKLEQKMVVLALLSTVEHFSSTSKDV